jgi:RNA polymerase sigma factor (sigma-70 family)
MRFLGTETAAVTREQAEVRFDQLYADHGVDLMAYSLRRSDGPEDAADVVAETFLVAWRRAGEVPSGPDALFWLYGVARRVLANHQRGERRRARLVDRLRVEVSADPSQPATEADGAVTRALELLGESDREILLLAGWEGLEPAQIARVLGISAVAARSRLHRARRRLRKQLDQIEAADGTRPCSALELEEAR